MEFQEKLASLAAKIRQQKSVIQTEEATKNAFVMPFIQSVLGYDVFDPTEVVPEFVCDVGTKKGEKIDYAILKDGQIQILIESKKIGEPLNINHASQLFRYFHVTTARISILTNGQVYRFFTDLDATSTLRQPESRSSPMARSTASSLTWMPRTRWTKSRSSNSTFSTLMITSCRNCRS